MRRVRTKSGAPAVQIVHKRGRTVLAIDHISSAQDEGLPLEDRHRLMNRRIFQYGAWLADQARAHDLPVVEALPFESLLDRAGQRRTALKSPTSRSGLVSQLVKALSGAACRRAIRPAVDLVGPSFVVIVTTAETAPQTPASGRLAIAEIVYQRASQVLQ